MARDEVVIIGAGGFGREVLDVLHAINAQAPTFEIRGFVVEPGFQEPGERIHGVPVLGYFDWLERNAGRVRALCGVGAPAVRRRMVETAASFGVEFANAVHPRATMSRWVRLGAGTIVTAGCILTNDIAVGEHVHLNLASTVGHDVVIEDTVTVSPGVHVSGNVRLAEGSFLGTGANLIEGVHVGSWSVVGAGATVIEDVPANATVVGVPARTTSVRDPGWHLRP
ncbi:MAG: acetyltransferase [Myxococcota bacterium]